MKKLLSIALASVMALSFTVSAAAETTADGLATVDAISAETTSEEAVISSEELMAYYKNAAINLINEAEAYLYSNDIYFNGTDLEPDVDVYNKYKSALTYLISDGTYNEETASYTAYASNALYYQYCVLQMDIDREHFLSDTTNEDLLKSVAASVLDYDYSDMSKEELYDAVKDGYGKLAQDSFAYVPGQYHEGIVAKFSDISSSDWYYDAVKYACDNELFLGTSDTEFSPDATMTRAMFITVLGRMASIDYAGSNESFSDVMPDEYYAPFVAWANENGILSWIGTDSFLPDQSITREEMFTCMYYTAVATNNDVSNTDASAAAAFSDYGTVSDYALEATAWAVNMGIVNGNEDNTLAPKATATRAEVAQIMKNFSGKMYILNINSVLEQLDKQ